MIKTYEIQDNPNGGVIINIDIRRTLNNIGQDLQNLISINKLFYLGLESDEDRYKEYKHTTELNMVYAKKLEYSKLKDICKKHISKNYTVSLIEIINKYLIETIKFHIIMTLRFKGHNKEEFELEINKTNQDLLKKHLPELLEEIDKIYGETNLKENIRSINDIRKIFVHRYGIVDKNEIELVTWIPQFLSYNESERNKAINEEENKSINFKKIWIRNQEIELDYEDCLRMKLTILSYFNYIIEVLIPNKYPGLRINENA